MRPWAEELLSESRLKHEGYFSAAPIRQKWSEHVSGRRNWQAQMWGVLMFQAWLEQHKSADFGQSRRRSLGCARWRGCPRA